MGAMTRALPKSNDPLSEALNATLLGLLDVYESEDRLGRLLGITGSAVNKIKNGKNWPSFPVA